MKIGKMTLEAVEHLQAALTIQSKSTLDTVTDSELAAALESNIVAKCIATQIEYMRDPDGYFSEEHSGE